jgi:hypothetical protein
MRRLRFIVVLWTLAVCFVPFILCGCGPKGETKAPEGSIYYKGPMSPGGKMGKAKGGGTVGQPATGQPGQGQ